MKWADLLNIQAKGKLQAEIQAHRKVAPTVHTHPNTQMLDKGKGEDRKERKWSSVLLLCGRVVYWLDDMLDRSGKSVSAGGLHTDWKKRAQVQPPSIAATTESNTKAIARQTRAHQPHCPRLLLHHQPQLLENHMPAGSIKSWLRKSVLIPLEPPDKLTVKVLKNWVLMRMMRLSKP